MSETVGHLGPCIRIGVVLCAGSASAKPLFPTRNFFLIFQNPSLSCKAKRAIFEMELGGCIYT